MRIIANDESKIDCESEIKNGRAWFEKYFVHQRHQHRNNNKTKKYNRKIQRPYSENSPHIKFRNTECTGFIFFFQQKISDEKTGEHKKEIHAKHSCVRMPANKICKTKLCSYRKMNEQHMRKKHREECIES